MDSCPQEHGYVVLKYSYQCAQAGLIASRALSYAKEEGESKGTLMAIFVTAPAVDSHSS